MLATLLASMLQVPSSQVPPSEAPPRERIEEIALSASGQAGRVTTRPEFIGGKNSVYTFGEGVCRNFRLSDRMLEQLFDALRRNAWVRVEAKEVTQGKSSAHCIQAVSFFAKYD